MKALCAALSVAFLLVFYAAVQGCALRVRGTGNAQADSLEVDFEKSGEQSSVTTSAK